VVVYAAKGRKEVNEEDEEDARAVRGKEEGETTSCVEASPACILFPAAVAVAVVVMAVIACLSSSSSTFSSTASVGYHSEHPPPPPLPPPILPCGSACLIGPANDGVDHAEEGAAETGGGPGSRQVKRMLLV